MDKLVIKTEDNYKVYVDLIKNVSKNESVEYLERHKKILNTSQAVIGVAMVNIRKLAKQIFAGGHDSFLKLAIPRAKENQYFEETLIEGLVIAQIKNKDEMQRYLELWLDKIDNWATCDSVTSSFKHIKFDDDYFDYFYEKCFDKKEFVSRFGITIIMNNFLDEKYLNRIFEMCEKVKSDAYYVKMAIAWLLSFCFMKFRDRTLEYLQANTLDKFTHNKAIAKCRDSYQVSADDKEFLKTLRK